jgi:hypothetical protein
MQSRIRLLSFSESGFDCGLYGVLYTDNRPNFKARIPLEDPKNSHHAKHWVTDHDLFGCWLTFGDKLLSLKVAFATAATTFENGIFKYFAVHQRVTAT